MGNLRVIWGFVTLFSDFFVLKMHFFKKKIGKVKPLLYIWGIQKQTHTNLTAMKKFKKVKTLKDIINDPRVDYIKRKQVPKRDLYYVEGDFKVELKKGYFNKFDSTVAFWGELDYIIYALNYGGVVKGQLVTDEDGNPYWEECK